jgi:vitamin B12 transporter
VSGFAKYTSQDYTGRSQFVELYTSLNLHKHLDLVAGTDYRWQNTDQQFFSISSFGPFTTILSGDTARSSMYSIYASLLLKQINGFYFELGGRYNHHSVYGSNSTFTLNPSYLLNDQWKIFANFSSAFKAPSLYQLYDPSVGQPGLKPEKSTTFEGGIQFTHSSKKFNTRFVYFNRDIKDGIDFNYFDFKYFNNNRQKDHGFEWEAGLFLDKLNFNFNFTYVTGEVNTTKYIFDPNLFIYIPIGDTTYNNLFRRPKHLLNMGAGYQFTPQLFVKASARFVGKRFEGQFFAEPIEMDSYKVFDIYAEYLFVKKLRVFIDVRNLLDEDYFDVRGFNTKPRNFMIGVSFEF